MRHLWRGPGARIARAAPWILAGFFGICSAALTLPPLAATQAGSTAASGDEAQARAVCSTCHAFPPPDILPRSAWRMEIVRMHYIRENRLPPVTQEAIAQTPLPADLEQAL